MITVENIPKDKPWLDFSSLSLLMKCPRAYHWRVMREVALAEPSISIINGEAYHVGKATYYKERLRGTPHKEAVEIALRSIVPIMQRITVEDKKRNLSVAFATLNQYFEFWKDEPYKTLEVEVIFAVDLIDFLFVGKIDRYVEHTTLGKMIEETKTTTVIGERWGLRTKPNLQMLGYASAVYLLTGEMPAGGVLDVIPIHEKVGDKKYFPFRLITMYNVEDVEDWISNIREWWITLSRYKESGVFPQNTEACAPLVGFTCEYNLLCSTVPHPHRMKETLELPAEYKIEPWRPFETLKEVENESGRQSG